MKQRPIKTPAPLGSGRSKQAKTVKGAISPQEAKLGGHRKSDGGGKGTPPPEEYHGSKQPDMSASDDRGK